MRTARAKLHSINRHLQVSVAAGTVILAAVFEIPGIEGLLGDISIAGLVVVAAVYGLPSMLLVFGHPGRSAAERARARSVATLIAVPAVLVTLTVLSQWAALVLPAALLTTLQISCMHALERIRKA